MPAVDVMEEKCHPETLYTNLDHTTNKDVIADVADDPELWAQHAAWNFCGWIRFDQDEQKWIEEVWVGGKKVAQHEGEDVALLIEQVNDKYGSE